ncbi:uncharacterized protein LOC130892747 [Diorhabda carinulata]|uniref:uncharacterized protein LOC130892747 n=1 Tax=Diorhabda carinulata TaxID=1163345 RepID=UPI0025A0DA4B|nr:uncharacterized protein LOC130892747 [Diorhabda carinulata]
MFKYHFVLIFVIIGIHQSVSCKVSSVEIPTEIRNGDNVLLVCNYDIGDEPLYNLKWFKGPLEFYRYTPGNIPHKMIFPLPGVTVDVNNSTNSKVVLKNVESRTSGKYSCEVSTDAPTFDFCSGYKDLHVKNDQSTNCKIENVTMPAVVNVGDDVTLVCEYDIGDNPLYIVKWYKDRFEFYRYSPVHKPDKMIFPLSGIDVDINESSTARVVLKNVSQLASGNYSCEVITDLPRFYTCQKSGNLYVNTNSNTSVENKKNKTTYIHANVPHFAQAGGNAVLSCNYYIDNLKLYTVKWYKDNKEFFRFTPWRRPQTEIFPVPGVNINVNSISYSRVILRNVDFKTTGKYECEVKSDAPDFIEIEDSGFLSILVPNGEPRILIDNDLVAVGQRVQAVCIVPGSYPPAQIIWILNGNEVKDYSIAKQFNRTDLSIPSASFVNLKVSKDWFEHSKANLSCAASIGKIYQADTTVIIRELESET